MNHAPKNATPYGAIAYRIVDVAEQAFDRGHVDLARKLWGISDDLVALDLAADDGDSAP